MHGKGPDLQIYYDLRLSCRKTATHDRQRIEQERGYR